MNIKTITNKFKIISSFFIKHIKSSSILISIILVGSIGIFLYFNFYQTMISAKKIIILQADVSPAKIKINLLEKIKDKYQKKLEIKEYNWDKYQNVFKTVKKTSNSSTKESDSVLEPNTTF